MEQAGWFELLGRELSAIDGWWYRGGARLGIIPRTAEGGFALRPPYATEGEGVQVIEVSSFVRRYQVAKRMRLAVRQFRALATDWSEESVLAFVNQYGALLDFSSWVSRAGPPTLADVPIGTDAFMFVNWCEQHGHQSAADYVRFVFNSPERPSGLPEPLVLYAWAAEQLERLDKELDDDEPSPLVERWLAARLDELRLRLKLRHEKGQPRRLVIRGTTLLAYLAAYTVLDVSSVQLGWRVCEGCGKAFEPQHGRQRFHDVTCAERSKKRRQRAGKLEGGN